MRKWRALIIASFLFLGMIGGGAWGIYRYTLGLKTIAIEGNHYVTQEEIRTLVTPFQGRNALLLSVSGRLRTRLTGALPKVATVITDYKWPRAIKLTVIEKKPWIGLVSNDHSVVLAEDGTVLDRRGMQPLDETQLLIVRNVPEIFFTKTTINPYLLNNLRPIVSVIRDYFPDQSLQLELKGLVLSPASCAFDEMILIKDDTVPVYVGSEAKLATKLDALRQFLWYAQVQRSASGEIPSVQYIDLRVLGKVIVNYGT